MIGRRVTEADLPKIAELLEKHGLPSDRLMSYASDFGLVVCEGDKILGACFLYFTNSPLTYVDLFVVNKDLSKTTREEVITKLITDFVAISKYQGTRCIIAEPLYKKSVNRLKDFGFFETKSGKLCLEF